MSTPDPAHILLTTLGTRPKPATYALGDRHKTAKVATAALYALLPATDRPDQILAFCTPEAARDSLPMLADALAAACPIKKVDISSDPTKEAIDEFLASLVREVPPEASLTVDLTHGFRHLSFLTYAGVVYLTAVRGVRLRAAYYGMFSPEGLSSFFDVRPLVELPQWFHALRVLRDAGSAHVMADLIAASNADDAETVAGALRTLSEAYASGLPIELGHEARRFLATRVEPLRTVLRDDQRLPLADELVADFADILKGQQLAQELPEAGWKAKVQLNRAELERQARIIDSFLERLDYPNALGLMREWLVLWAMWRTGAADRWLDYHSRGRTESRLHALARRTNPDDSRAEAAVGHVWGKLTKLRNQYAHHGLDDKEALSTEPEVNDHAQRIREGWAILREVPEFSLLPSKEPGRRAREPERRVLVSPIGMRPGALFSALRAAKPDRVSRCLVICSTASEGFITRACQEAGYAGPVELLRLDDPFIEDAKLEQWVKKAKQHLRDADDVLVNITGGTTMMGVLVDRIATEARQLDRPTRRFALIDQRTSAEQEADPYQEGRVCWLDSLPAAKKERASR